MCPAYANSKHGDLWAQTPLVTSVAKGLYPEIKRDGNCE